MRISNKILFTKFWVLTKSYKYAKLELEFIFVFRKKMRRISFPIWIKPSGLSEETIANIKGAIFESEKYYEKM